MELVCLPASAGRGSQPASPYRLMCLYCRLAPPPTGLGPHGHPLTCSPFIPADKIADATQVGLELSIDGQVKQSGITKDMIFDIPTLISFVSGIMKLEEGDLLMTGTPAGVGPVKPGETVSVKLTYPGLDGEVLSEYDVKAVQRDGGFEFKE